MPQSIVAAVDLGYGHVKYAIHRDGHPVVDAFPSYVAPESGAPGDASLAAVGKLDVLRVAVAGRRFVVGRDASHALSRSVDRSRDAAYSTTEQYMALMLGALWHIGQPVIDVLVVGLPMNTLRTHANALRERLTGQHFVPLLPTARGSASPTSTITVRDVLVLGQPVGAYLDACVAQPHLSDATALVLDMGFNTLDMLGVAGGKPRLDRTDAFPGGVADFIEDLSQSVIETVKRTHPDLKEELRLPAHMYERAIRENRPLMTSLGTIDLQPHVKIAGGRLETYLDRVAAKLDNYGDIAVVVLAGGGARLLEVPFRRRFPLLRNVLVAKDPQFSVVRGFVHAGVSVATQREAAHA